MRLFFIKGKNIKGDVCMKDIKVREMTIKDYCYVIDLWEKTECIGLSESDSKEGISIYLKRNPGLSFVAVINDEVIGAALCGHDGQRGYIHHLAIDKRYRFNGIGKELVMNCLNKLKEQGIKKCHLFVLRNNHCGTKFWMKQGWKIREDLNIMSRDI